MRPNPSLPKRESSFRRDPSSRRVKLDELADHLGLSKSTVSRALNGYSDISDSTRKRVETTARKMGYRPLSHAQAIRTGKVRAIAMVINSGEPDRHNPFLQDFLAGACEGASAFDWDDDYLNGQVRRGYAQRSGAPCGRAQSGWVYSAQNGSRRPSYQVSKCVECSIHTLRSNRIRGRRTLTAIHLGLISQVRRQSVAQSAV